MWMDRSRRLLLRRDSLHGGGHAQRKGVMRGWEGEVADNPIDLSGIPAGGRGRRDYAASKTNRQMTCNSKCVETSLDAADTSVRAKKGARKAKIGKNTWQN